MGQIYDFGDNGPWVFLLVTCLIGGAAGFVSGRALAHTWRPFWQVPLYMVGVASGIRFIHYALFSGDLLSPGSLAIDFIVTATTAVLGYRVVRAGQMARQYSWLFERAGPVGWRRKG